MAFASGRYAIAQCDRCDGRFRLHQLRNEVVHGRPTGVMVCPECLDEDQPQLFLGQYPVVDPQAVRNPRPDQSLGVDGSRDIQWGWGPVGGGDSSMAPGVVNPLETATACGEVSTRFEYGVPN